MRYVIVGAGIAGTTAAENLRKLDKDSEIVLISEEQHPLYSRVLLTPYLVGKVPRERVFIKKEAWYIEQNIEWLRGEVVTRLDVKNKFVELLSGREIEYDKLLIATGAEARQAAWDMKGVAYFRNLNDADYLDQLIKQNDSKIGAVIYGGGFIACDLLQIFEKNNLELNIMFRGPYFWSRVLEKEVGEFINDHLKEKGVKVLCSTSIYSIKGDKQLETLETDKGDVDCSFLAVGIGTEKDFSWIKEAGVKVGSGIKCNEFLETNIENIYTAGDVAEFYDTITERQLSVGTWLNSIQQGRLVANNMADEKKAFELVSSYATNALGLEIIFIGDTSKPDADSVRVISDEQGKVQLFERGGRLVGAVLVNMNTQRQKITKMIQEKREASEFFV